jgi:hypothetical protein
MGQAINLPFRTSTSHCVKKFSRSVLSFVARRTRTYSSKMLATTSSAVESHFRKTFSQHATSLIGCPPLFAGVCKGSAHIYHCMMDIRSSKKNFRRHPRHAKIHNDEIERRDFQTFECLLAAIFNRGFKHSDFQHGRDAVCRIFVVVNDECAFGVRWSNLRNFGAR